MSPHFGLKRGKNGIWSCKGGKWDFGLKRGKNGIWVSKGETMGFGFENGVKMGFVFENGTQWDLGLREQLRHNVAGVPVQSWNRLKT